MNCSCWITSTIADIAPLASLTSLKRLYLEGCELDYSPLADIYPYLEDKDFVIIPKPSTLAEFGFVMDGDGNHVVYENEWVSVRINHIEWGDPGLEMWGQNCVRSVFGTDEYMVDIGYYPEHDTYVVLANKDGEWAVNYLYHPADGSFSFGIGDRESSDSETVRSLLSAAFGIQEKEMYTEPLVHLEKFLQERFSMGIDELYALPEQ